MIAFLILTIFQQAFTGIQTNFLEFVTQSRIPSLFLILLIAQFTLIIIERVIYLFRSLIAKLILQYVLVAFIHIAVFFYIPRATEVPFISSPGLVLFYMAKATYFYYSGLQVKLFFF